MTRTSNLALFMFFSGILVASAAAPATAESLALEVDRALEPLLAIISQEQKMELLATKIATGYNYQSAKNVEFRTRNSATAAEHEAQMVLKQRNEIVYSLIDLNLHPEAKAIIARITPLFRDEWIAAMAQATHAKPAHIGDFRPEAGNLVDLVQNKLGTEKLSAKDIAALKQSVAKYTEAVLSTANLAALAINPAIAVTLRKEVATVMLEVDEYSFEILLDRADGRNSYDLTIVDKVPLNKLIDMMLLATVQRLDAAVGLKQASELQRLIDQKFLEQRETFLKTILKR